MWYCLNPPPLEMLNYFWYAIVWTQHFYSSSSHSYIIRYFWLQIYRVWIVASCVIRIIHPDLEVRLLQLFHGVLRITCDHLDGDLSAYSIRFFLHLFQDNYTNIFCFSSFYYLFYRIPVSFCLLVVPYSIGLLGANGLSLP